MVTAVAAAPSPNHHHHPKRPPLLPSDNAPPPPPRRRPKSRDVTSRYLSSNSSSSTSYSSSTSSTNTTSSSATTPRRSQSPMIRTAAAIATTPRSHLRAASAERRRPAPGNAERMLVTSTMRSLSVSFQGEAYSVPVSKVKPPPVAAVGTTPGSLRKAATPERRKTPLRENSRPTDQQQKQHRWPGRLRGEDSGLLTRSLDYGSSVKGLRKSVVGDENCRDRVRAELRYEGSNVEVGGSRLREGGSSNSDGESVSSESTVSGNGIQLRGVLLGVVVPARSWQDTATPLPNCVSNRKIGPSKLIVAKKFQNGSPVSSPRDVCLSRGLSPIRGSARAASPCRGLSSATPSRGVSSPSRVRSGAGNLNNESNTCSTPSMLSFAVDVRRAKLGENRIAEAHDLRLLYNRLLQWRLANARVSNTMLVQEHAAERSLYNAWVTTSKLRQSVKSKGIELQSLRRNLKLYSLLKKQEPHLASWGLLDGDHGNSVSGAIKALEASTLRLPIVGGAKADVHKVQEAISSAVDVMQAMASSVCSLQVKVEQMNSLVSELSNLTTREHRLLDECKDYFSKTFIPLQVMHCSLRTQVMQVQCVQTISAKKV